MFTVFYVGKSKTGQFKDGETLKEFDTERDAVEYAQYFTDTHDNEFNDVCGGVCVADEKGKVVY